MDATYSVSGFLGGEISTFAQGRWDKPDYKNSLAVCLNAIPTEIGAWTRRPGSLHAGPTRLGGRGRTIKFDQSQATPYTVEYTDGFLRFRTGASLATNNDSQSVVSISTANPAVVTVGAAPASGATVVFSNNAPTLLQNRQFTWTRISGTTGSIADALTGATIDGSTLGALGAGVTMSSIQEVASPYIGGIWASLRMVQAEDTAVCLQATVAPQMLTVTNDPTATTFATFALGNAIFNDGPYLDPFTNGALATPNQETGIVTIALSFPAYSASLSYAKGDFVTSSSVNYESLVDQNIGNTPASSPSDWAPVGAGAAINDGQGFLPTDIGRLVRLLSEPTAWAAGSTYAAGTVVTYNPTATPGASTYWQSLTNGNVGKIPGTDITNWELVAPGSSLPSIAGVTASPAAAAGPAQWTWGKITALSNTVPNAPSGIAHVGDMTGGGGLAAAFDGNTAQNAVASASKSAAVSGSGASVTGYVGQNFSSCSPSAYAIQSATIFPSTDKGLAFLVAGYNGVGVVNLTAFLYGSNSAPSSATNGTLLGQTSIVSNVRVTGTGTLMGAAAVVISSNDTTTTYKYLWVVVIASFSGNGISGGSLTVQAAQVQFVQAGTGTSSNGVNVEILGPPLLYTTPIQTWRLGAYSNTTGWPTNGCYVSGRLWLGGAIANRFDASVSGGVVGNTINMAPTDQYGGVNDDNGISETLDADGLNQIQWMKPLMQGTSLRGILMGALGREWFVFAPGNGGLSPTNIDSNVPTKIGGANVLPAETEHTVVFVQRYSVKLMEYFPDVFSGKFTAPNLADKAQHITRAGIAELAYTHSATPIIWGRDNAGALFGVTYKRDTLMTSSGPTFYAWHRHALGSGRIVESLCQGPSVGGTLDALTMVTNDTTANIRHVEVLTDQLDELSTLSQASYLDDAIVPTSSSSSTTAVAGAPYGGLTLNGLWNLNGKTVTAWLGGLDCGDYVVANGSIFVPYGDGIPGNKGAGTANGLFTPAFVTTGVTANGVTLFTGTMPMVVGFTYNSDGQLVRPIAPQESGARNGPALGKLRRDHYTMALLSGVAGPGGLTSKHPLLIGTKFDSTLKPALLKVPNGGNVGIDTQFSGVFRDQFSSDYDFDGMICWRVTRPYICNIPSLGAALQTMDV